MTYKQKNSLVLQTEKPSLEKIPVGRKLVEEGKNLPNSVTEDIGGFSLMPRYSAKQLRGMHRRDVTRSKNKTWTNKGKGHRWRSKEKW